MSISLFLGAAAGGFLLMSVVGIQGLVALFSSVPLAKRRQQEHPEFDLQRARHRIVKTVVLTALVLGAVTALIIALTPISATFGYLFGMILAFVWSLLRMSPNSIRNQRQFDKTYADCYPQPDEVDLSDTQDLGSSFQEAMAQAEQHRDLD